MDGRYAVENIRGFSFFTCSHNRCVLHSLSFTLAEFYWQWIPERCSTIWILSVSAIIRRPAAGLLAWAFCRALLLNFWTFLYTHTWSSKKKKKKNQLTKNPKLLIGWHFRPGPCGNNDKPEGRWIKASNQQDRFQTSELFLMRVMSSVRTWMTAKAELSFDIPEKNLTVLHYFWEADFVWSFGIITCDQGKSWHLPPSLDTFSPAPLLAFWYCKSHELWPRCFVRI